MTKSPSRFLNCPHPPPQKISYRTINKGPLYLCLILYVCGASSDTCAGRHQAPSVRQALAQAPGQQQ